MSNPRTKRIPVKVYTDGACQPNPGRGGCAAILVANGVEMTVQAGYKHTTNNRMELLAVIIAMEALPMPCDITLYSDSNYVVDSVNKSRVFYWGANDWKLSSGEPAKNADLWQRFMEAYWNTDPEGIPGAHALKMVWVKAHAEDDSEETKYNNMADVAAVSAIEKVGANRVDPLFPEEEEEEGFFLS